MDTLNKLRWRCRRGTKELDLLLLKYLDNDYQLADATEQQAFMQLLALEDDKLLKYCLGKAAADDAELARVVRKLTTD
jgi:antitoxin CptB